MGEHVRGTLVGTQQRLFADRRSPFKWCAGLPWAISPSPRFFSACASFASRPATATRGTRAERNQVQWILLASLISLVLIAYLLAQAWIDPATLGRGNAAWPMFGVSLLYTMAYAFSITRYKLMQVEDDHQPECSLFCFQSDGGTDLFRRALGQRQIDRRSVVFDPFDLARGGRGGAFGVRGA